MKEVTDEKLAKYFDYTERALTQVKLAEEKPIEWKKSAEDFLDMAKRYLSDAKHFKEQGDYATALAAASYAHAWLDCGARLGLFDVDNKDDLFVVD